MKFEQQKLGRYGKQLVAETVPKTTIKIKKIRRELRDAIGTLTERDLNALHSHGGPAIVKISISVRRHVETATQGLSEARAMQWLASGNTTFPVTRVRGRMRPEMHFSPEAIAFMQKIDPFGWPHVCAPDGPSNFFRNYQSIAVIGFLINEMFGQNRKMTMQSIIDSTSLSHSAVNQAMNGFIHLCRCLKENEEATKQVGGELGLWSEPSQTKGQTTYYIALQPFGETTSASE